MHSLVALIFFLCILSLFVCVLSVCMCVRVCVVSVCREQVASLALLADMTAQAKAIEIMISHVNQVNPFTPLCI